MDPVTAMATASAAFAAIKKGFSIGRDIESMASDLGRWMGALSDLEQAEKEAKNPPIFKKIINAKSVEQEAMEIFAATRKAKQQRDDLRQFLLYTVGASAWDELVRMEARIRKQRQETLYKQRERRRKFIEAVAIVALCATVVGFFVLILWLYLQKRQG